MPLAIDGNNLLHNLPATARSRSGVRRQVLDAVRHEGLQVTVVFDGPPPAGSPSIEHLGRVTVRYSGATSADDVILSLIPAGRAASQWVVVTNDRGLSERAKQRGARARSLVEWRGRRPVKPGRRAMEPPMSAREIAEWEAFFAEGGDEDSR